MVTTESRNNIMILILVVVVGIMVLYFMTTFASTMQQAARDSGQVVNSTAKNVTDTFSQVTILMTKQINLMEQERDANKENLNLFLNTFKNQSQAQVDAVHDLKNTSTQDRKNQTNVFVQTLLKSQNLTSYSINTTKERNAIMDRLIDVLINKTEVETGQPLIRGNLTPVLVNQSSPTTNQ